MLRSKKWFSVGSLAVLGVLAGSANATTVDRIVRMATLPFRSTVEAHDRVAHTFYVGSDDYEVWVRGDGDTDLDCWIYDARGRLVDSDEDDTDICMLRTPGIGQHRLEIKNWGRVSNVYTVRRQ